MTSNKRTAKSWLSWVALVAVFTTACFFLSQWQFARQDEVVKANALIKANYDAKVVELDKLLSPNQDWDKNLEYRAAYVRGKYIPEQSYLVRNRPFNAYPGFLQLVAFQAENGSIIWVERGWLPTGSKSDYPDDVPSVDAESREIKIRLRPGEPRLDRTSPQGQLSSIDLKTASESLEGAIFYSQAYGRLVAEIPELPTGELLPRPELSEGNHLSYAMQWILFGLMAIGAVVWTIAQERRRQSGLPPRKLRVLNRDKDAEVEDEILK